MANSSNGAATLFLVTYCSVSEQTEKGRGLIGGVVVVGAFPVYQTEHLSTGFIFDPRGQFQAAANSGLLDNGPSTRNLIRG